MTNQPLPIINYITQETYKPGDYVIVNHAYPFTTQRQI